MPTAPIFLFLGSRTFCHIFFVIAFQEEEDGGAGGHFLLQLVKFVTENRAVMDGIIIGRKERIEVCGPGNFCISRC